MGRQDQPRQPLGLLPRWIKRFADASDGIRIGVSSQPSLWVHLVVTAMVMAMAVAFKIEVWQWCVCILCIALVISLELMNSAIEQLIKTLHPEHHPGLAAVLHLSAAAVLVSAVGSVIMGLMIFLPFAFA